jgi:MFS superfamily sulfate permease-like transporter
MAWLYEPPANVTEATQMIGWVNTTTGQWLFQGIIGTVFGVSLITMMNNQSNTASKSFAAASFVTMIIAVMSRVLNLIPTWYMSIWIVMVGLSAVWMYSEGTL